MTKPFPAIAAWLALALPLTAQQGAPAAPPKPAPAALLDQALHVAKTKNRRVLVAVLGTDATSGALGTAMKKDRTLSRQLLYEFAVVTLQPTDTEVLQPLGIDPAKMQAPLLVVLDADKKPLARLEAAALTADGAPIGGAALGKLLEPHHCAKQDAEALLCDALATCKREQKTLLLHFDAPW